MLVAPHGGAWIEMTVVLKTKVQDGVAPHGGAWIEMRQNGVPTAV